MRDVVLYSEQELQDLYENDPWSYVARMSKIFGCFDEGENDWNLYQFLNQHNVETVPIIYEHNLDVNSWEEIILSKKVFLFQLIHDTKGKVFEIDTLERKVRFSKDTNYNLTTKALGRIFNEEDNEINNTYSGEYFEEFLDRLGYEIEFNL